MAGVIPAIYVAPGENMSDSWFLIDNLKRFAELACAKAKYAPCSGSKRKEDFYFYNYRSQSHSSFFCTITSGNFSRYEQSLQLGGFQSWFPEGKPEMLLKTSHRHEDVLIGAESMIRLSLIMRRFIEETMSLTKGNTKVQLYWCSPWHFIFSLQGHNSASYERKEENILAAYERLRVEIEPNVQDALKRRFIDVQYLNGDITHERFYPLGEQPQ
jgi:hypothetical protein